MAVVGTAYVQIRAIADKFNSDLQKQLSTSVGKTAGEKIGKDVSDGIKKNTEGIEIDAPKFNEAALKKNVGSLGRAFKNEEKEVNSTLDNIVNRAQAMGKKAGPSMIASFGSGNISMLMKRFFYMLLWGTPIVGALVGAISSLVSGAFALGSALGPALNTLAILPGLLSAIVTPAIAGVLAFQGLGDAYSAGVAAMKGGQKELKKYQEELKKLNPQAQGFVKTLIANRDAFIAVKNAAGSQIFGPLTNALNTIVGNGFLNLLSKGLADAGGALGGLAEKVANLTSQPFFQNQFNNLMLSNVTVFKSIGDTLVNLISLFVALGNAARPVTEEFAKWIATVTGNWADSAQNNMGGLMEKIQSGAGVVRQLGRVFGNLWDIIKNVGEAARPAGQILLNAFEGATQRLAELTADSGNKEKLRQYFIDVAENVQAIADVITDVGLGFAKLGDNPAIKQMADIIKSDVVPALFTLLETATDKVGPQLADTFAKIVEVFSALADSGGLNAYLDVIDGVADAFIKLTTIPGFGTFIGYFAAFVGTFKAFSLVAQVFQINAIAGGIGNFVAGFRNAGEAASKATGLMGTLGGFAKQAGKDIGAGIKGGFQVAKVGAEMTFNSIKSAGSSLVSGAKSIGTGIAQGITGGLQVAKTGVQMTFNSMKSAAVSAGTAAANAGKAIASGFANAGRTLATAAASAGRFAVSMAQTAAAATRAGIAAAAAATKTLLIAAAEKAVAAARKIGAAAQWLLNAAMSANPIGLIIAAVVALVAAFVWLWNNVEGFRNFFKAVWEGIVNVFNTVVEAIGSAMSSLWDKIVSVWNFIVAAVQIALQAYWTVITTVFNAVVSFVSTVWNGIVNVVTTVWNWIVNVVTTAITTVWNIIVTVFTTVWNFITTIWNNVVNAIQTAWNWIVAVVQIAIATYWNIIVTVFNAVSSFITGLWNGIASFFSSVWNSIIGFVTTAVANVWNVVVNTFNNVRSAVTSIFSAIAGFVSSVWNGIASNISAIANGIWSNVTGIFNRIASAIGGAFASVAGTVASAFNGIVGVIRSAINGVIGLVNRAIGAINGISVSIPDWVPGVGGQSFGVNIPKIPQLAKGGTVAASPNGTLALIAEAGKSERVEPLDANGLSAGDRAVIAAIESGGSGQNIHITINPPPETDVFTLAKLVSREIEFIG